MSWCTIESDPGVFTSLIEDIGVKGVQVEELYGLDESSFQSLRPIYGLIFLFKWDPSHQTTLSADSMNVDTNHDNVFFAKQVITNACATQAILSILMNSSEIDIGEKLREFKTFTEQFPPDLKGLAISNSDMVRNAHNSFARPEPFIMEETTASEKDDAYHFIAYVPIGKKVYELDGLKESPICLGSYDADWLTVASPAIQSRIEKYSQNEIRFNLLSLVANKKQACETKIRELIEQSGRTSINDLPISVQMEIQQYQEEIKQEEKKFQMWKVENIRRKHNYIPFIVQLLKILAKKNQLQPLIDQQNQVTGTST